MRRRRAQQSRHQARREEPNRTSRRDAALQLISTAVVLELLFVITIKLGAVGLGGCAALLACLRFAIDLGYFPNIRGPFDD